MYAELLKLLNQIATLDKEEEAMIKERFKLRRLAKGEFFLKAGEIKALNLINQQIDSDEAELNLFTDKITVLKLLNQNDEADKISDSLWLFIRIFVS